MTPTCALRHFRFPILCGAIAFLLPAVAAQIAITSLGVAVTENFDSIGESATASLPSSWLMTAAGVSSVTWSDAGNVSVVNKAASSGTPTAAGRYNWGQSAGDRAIGFMTSGSYASPNSILAQFSNQTGSTITQISLSFDYERYRINTAAAAITFFHSTDGSNWNSAGAGDSGAFSTGTSSYGFTSLVSSASRTVTLSSLDLGPGSSLYLRWNFATNGSNSQGLGLDNFSLTASAVPEPSTYAAIAGAATLAGAIWHRRRQRLRLPVPPGSPEPRSQFGPRGPD